MAEREYYRLTRARRRPGIAAVAISSFSLWLGRDHLLLIETNGYTETYKRFYFRDIQAIIVRRTKARAIITIVLSVLASLLLLIGVLTEDTVGMVVFSVIAFFTCLIPLVANLTLGPTCSCQLRTAVQTEEMPIRRIGKARKILQRLRPLIAEAQGEIPPEEVQTQMLALVTGAHAVGAAPLAPVANHVVDDINAPPRIVP